MTTSNTQPLSTIVAHRIEDLFDDFSLIVFSIVLPWVKEKHIAMLHIMIDCTEWHYRFKTADFAFPIKQFSVKKPLFQFRVKVGIDGISDCYRTLVMATGTRYLFGSAFAHDWLNPGLLVVLGEVRGRNWMQ